MKRTTKFFVYPLVALILIILIWWVGSAAWSGWNSSKWQKKTDAFQNALEQPYKEDIYGGKTPEETWGMYVAALEKKDFELAVKYYAISHQERARTYINRTEEKGRLETWISELKTLEKDLQQQDSEKLTYSYKYYDDQSRKELWGSVSFYQNPYTKVWKILF